MAHATLQTATGTIVNHGLTFWYDEFTDDEKQQEQQEVLNDYPGTSPTYYTKLDGTSQELLPTNEYNCWGFTFDPRRCVISSGTDVQNILNDNANPVPDGSVEIGDVICYRNYGGIQHTGRVCEVDSQGHATLIRSKWGGWGEYLHPPLTVPSSYGTDISYWRMHTHLQGRAVLFIKDNSLDTSFQCSSVPFGASPDIWVDSDLDGNPDPEPIANQINHVYATVRNEGTVVINNVEVRFYWADPAGGIPPSDWNLIGTFTIPSISANSQAEAGPVSWTPQSVPETQCLLVIANGGDSIIDDYEPDPIVYPFDVRWENGIAMKIVNFGRELIDVEMVMDVSDSMNSPSPSDPGGDSKLTMMKQAVTMITDFLHDNSQVNDRMGLVWFTDDASEYVNPYGQKLLPIQANSADLRAEINAHGTGTCTAMGAGLQTAFDTLASSTQQRFVILCTDGMQNVEPKVVKEGSHYEIKNGGGWLCGSGYSSVPEQPGVDITTYDTCIHTIGVGITATYASLLEEIANETGGFYRGTDDPENDLDLIYFVDLCNCLAGGSPAIVHHNTGIFYPEGCEAVENFYLNRSIRKITVMLSWKESQGANLIFWLKNPDGIVLNLHDEMKIFENHCLATIYLPKQQDGEELAYIGQWQMIIRGEIPGSHADYHAFVIGDDHEIKYQIGYPRRLYEVGDFLPIRIDLTELKKPISKVNEILMETAHLHVPLPELFAEYRVSSYELRQKLNVGMVGKTQKGPIIQKIEAMASDPRFRERLKPSRNYLSLRKGELECKIEEKEILIPVLLKQPGLHTFKVAVQCETPENGPVHRTDMVSVNVGPGKADPKLSRVNLMGISAKNREGWLINVTPRNERGQLLGPGLGHEFKVIIGKKELEIEVEDRLDGTYQIELSQPRTKAKRDHLPVNIMFRGRSVWKGLI